MSVYPAASAVIYFLFRRRHHLLLLLHLLLRFPYASPMTFSITNFQPDNPNITFQGDASAQSGAIRLTNDEPWSAGWAVFSRPVRLFDNETLTSFTTTFKFGISATGTSYGDGLAFFLAAKGTGMPNNSAGGYLGLFDNTTDGTSTSLPQMVAVEFDTRENDWDPSYPHVGFDVGSIRSRGTTGQWGADPSTGSPLSFQARVTFDGSRKNLTVSVTGATGSTILSSAPVDLNNALPEWVIVGFSAATSDAVEAHEIYSWSFDSTLDESSGPALPPPSPAPTFRPIGNPPPAAAPPTGGANGSIPAAPAPDKQLVAKEKKIPSRTWVIILATAVPVVLVVGIIALLTISFCRRGVEAAPTLGDIAPREFSYIELKRATNNFDEERVLGKGGFGTVFRGKWKGSDVAVKRVEKWAEKSFKIEAMAVGRLSHRNLVRLIGWCIAKKQRCFFIVYEYVPNWSLDLHLFGGVPPGKKDPLPPLSWETRHRVVLGLGLALKYLHEEGRDLVIHRDIKPANVILDDGYNPRLGDFGLARLGTHGHSMPPTGKAGTDGYMAPEDGGRQQTPSRQSDVYSFGVVALAVATGKKALFEGNLVAWVRNRHLQGEDLLGAADNSLDRNNHPEQITCLLKVGLWCTLHNPTRRPPMSRVIQYLEGTIPVPEVPRDEREPPPAGNSGPQQIRNSVLQTAR